MIECSFSESSETRQCFGAVGQPLIFHLSNTENAEITLKKDDKYRILKANKDGTVTLDEYFTNQTGDIYNGIINLGTATKRHSGDYTLEEYSSDGRNLKTVHVHLKIHGG